MAQTMSTSLRIQRARPPYTNVLHAATQKEYFLNLKAIKIKMKEQTICPKCKSKNVKLNITASASLGAPQMWGCNDCDYQNYLFPKIKIKQILKKKTKWEN